MVRRRDAEGKSAKDLLVGLPRSSAQDIREIRRVLTRLAYFEEGRKWAACLLGAGSGAFLLFRFLTR